MEHLPATNLEAPLLRGAARPHPPLCSPPLISYRKAALAEPIGTLPMQNAIRTLPDRRHFFSAVISAYGRRRESFREDRLWRVFFRLFSLFYEQIRKRRA